MQRGDLPYEGYESLTDRHVSIEDTMRVKAVKRPGRPKKRDAERVRNRPVNYELSGRYGLMDNDLFARWSPKGR